MPHDAKRVHDADGLSSCIQIDDIVVRMLPTGRYTLPALEREFHAPHLCMALLPLEGSVTLESETPCPDLADVTDSVLVAPWQRHYLTVVGRLIGIEFPSYRLNACSLTPLRLHRLNESDSPILAAMVQQVLMDGDRLSLTAQRFVANALSTMAALPPPDTGGPSSVHGAPQDADLRTVIASEMRARMHEEYLRAEDVTDSLGMSRAQLYRTLSPYGGFKTCLHAQRLDAMARRLKGPADNGLSIKALLFRHGFSTTEQFQRLFHKRFNISARDFRRGKRPTADTFGDSGLAQQEV